jgi:hypothetical protein
MEPTVVILVVLGEPDGQDQPLGQLQGAVSVIGAGERDRGQSASGQP